MEEFYQSCGYIATFMGTLLEGEFSLITSMIGAKVGYYNTWIAMMAAFLGAWVADWFKYLVGKTKGKDILTKKPKIKSKIDKATVWFEKYPYLILTFYKFMLGTTTVILLLSGIKNVSYWRFALHSAISVLLWVAVIGGLALHCSEVILDQFDTIKDYGLIIVGSGIVLALGYWYFIKRPRDQYCMEDDVHLATLGS